MIWKYDRVFLCQKNLTSGFVQVSGKFFSIMALADVNDGGTPYMGISPGRARPSTRFIRLHCCRVFSLTLQF